MSIDTLLEAARFLEWQTQQQITREEEVREKVLQEREAEKRRAETAAAAAPPVRINHVTWGEESRVEHQLTPVPPPPLPHQYPLQLYPSLW
ncbi:hypothetical protein AGOR_G00020610 [Albula goreensis]|uniref:MAX network transcriptional repressor a n=1 Tax=Albula goreensis TaxID=1534307 RepID=A0A8T3E7U4_9TELE|nr:hypothetical protein AGOR_G00020610 [Albula goreensis]